MMQKLVLRTASLKPTEIGHVDRVTVSVLTGPEIEPQSFSADNSVFKHYANRLVLFLISSSQQPLGSLMQSAPAMNRTTRVRNKTCGLIGDLRALSLSYIADRQRVPVFHSCVCKKFNSVTIHFMKIRFVVACANWSGHSGNSPSTSVQSCGAS